MTNDNAPAVQKKRSRIRGEEGRTKFREQLLAEAKEIYSKHGYEAVSVRSVTKAVGISTMAFYGYFVSKQDLVKHIWLDFFRDLFEFLLSAGRDACSPAEALKAHIEAYLEYWESHPDRYRIVYLATSPDNEGAGIRFDESDLVAKKLLVLTRQRISACAGNHSFAEEKVRLLGDLIFVKVLGYLHGVLTVEDHPFDDVHSLRTCLVADIVDGVMRATRE